MPDIELLTDWQIEHLFFRPEFDRANRERVAAGLAPLRDGQPEPVTMEDGGEIERNEDDYVRNAKSIFGQSEEYWRKQWKAQHKKG